MCTLHTRIYSHQSTHTHTYEGCDDHYVSWCVCFAVFFQVVHFNTLVCNKSSKKIEGVLIGYSIVEFQFASHTTDALKCLNRFFLLEISALNSSNDIDNSIHMTEKKMNYIDLFLLISIHSLNFKWREKCGIIQIRTIWYEFDLVAYQF